MTTAMKFSQIIAAFASATSISAFPLLSLYKRELGGVSVPLYIFCLCLMPYWPFVTQVLLCTGANSTGTCSHEVYEFDVCHQLKAPFYHNTSTFSPDGEDFFCYPRTVNCDDICKSPTGCTFGPVDYEYENKANLTAIEWNTLISSFRCKRKDKSWVRGCVSSVGYLWRRCFLSAGQLSLDIQILEFDGGDRRLGVNMIDWQVAWNWQVTRQKNISPAFIPNAACLFLLLSACLWRGSVVASSWSTRLGTE